MRLKVKDFLITFISLIAFCLLGANFADLKVFILSKVIGAFLFALIYVWIKGIPKQRRIIDFNKKMAGSDYLVRCPNCQKVLASIRINLRSNKG